MKANAGGDIHIKVRVVSPMKTPEYRNAMAEPMEGVRREIQKDHGKNNIGQSVDMELLQQSPTGAGPSLAQINQEPSRRGRCDQRICAEQYQVGRNVLQLRTLRNSKWRKPLP